tara:strand:- start:62 stop:661 length:600 start_codon:yes stop_codon:yes gene_type:complete
MIKKIIVFNLFYLFCSYNIFANDINEFGIDNIYIGDSLSDHFSKNEISNATINKYPGSNAFIDYLILSNKNSKYENYRITVKSKDTNFIIHSISGDIGFNYKFEECMEYKKNVFNDIINIYPDLEFYQYEWLYSELADGKSFAKVDDFLLSSGSIRLYCVNSSATSKRELNMDDYFSIEISTNEVLDWLSSDANTGNVN